MADLSPADKINYVVHALADPCDPPFQIYIESFLDALWQAFLQLYVFDIQQVYSSFIGATYFRQKRAGHQRGGGNKRKPKPHTWLTNPRQWLNWDPNEAIGEAAGSWEGMEPKRPGLTNQVLFTAFGQIERLLNIVLIINVTVDFWYNFAAGLHESAACQAARQAWLSAVGPDQGASGLLDVWPMILPDIVKQRGDLEWNVTSGRSTYGPVSLALSAALTEDPANPVHPWSSRLAVVNNATGVTYHSELITGEGGEAQICITAGEFASLSVGTTNNGLTLVKNCRVTLVGMVIPPIV